AENDEVFPSSEVLPHAGLLAIEGLRLDLMADPDFKKDYNAIRSEIHDYMLDLIKLFLLPEARVCSNMTVLSLARNALQTCLNWESDHMYTYDNIHHGPPPLYDLQYLRALESKLESASPQETAVSTHDGVTKNEPHPHPVSGGRKRRANVCGQLNDFIN
ncbi:hypothetical protein H0H93_002596, partial [Arthromyces matolae]